MEKNLAYNLKKRLQEGEIVFGQMIGPKNDPEKTARALKEYGYDFLIIDNEHSLVDKETIYEYISASREAGLPIFMRVEEATANFRCYLDSGINGLLLPRLKTIGQIVYALNQAYLPPIGQRGSGIGMSPYLLDEQSPAEMPLGEMTEYINNNTLVFPMTETEECYRDLQRIISFTGVTGTIVGVNDFTLDIGNYNPRSLRSELSKGKAVEERLRRIAVICKKTGKAAGMGGLSPNDFAKWAKEGYQVFLMGYVIGGNIENSRSRINELKSLLETN